MFDGHAGDFVVQLVHTHFKLNLMRKIQKAAILKRLDTLVLDYQNCKSDYEYNQVEPKIDERSEEFMEFLKVAVVCLQQQNCTMDTPGFNEKFDELVQMSKMQEYKLQKDYEAKCYVKNGKINYKNMLIDELLLAEYYSLNLAREFVSKIMLFFNFL